MQDHYTKVYYFFFFTEEQLEIEIKIVPFKRAPKSTKYLELSLNKIYAMSIN